MAEGDIVRRVTITANDEGIDSTTSSVESLWDAISKVGPNSDLSLSALASFGVRAIATISGFVDYDLPLSSHPVAVRVSGFCTPSGAGGATDDRRSWSGLRSRWSVAVRWAA